MADSKSGNFPTAARFISGALAAVGLLFGFAELNPFIEDYIRRESIFPLIAIGSLYLSISIALIFSKTARRYIVHNVSFVLKSFGRVAETLVGINSSAIGSLSAGLERDNYDKRIDEILNEIQHKNQTIRPLSKANQDKIVENYISSLKRSNFFSAKILHRRCS